MNIPIGHIGLPIMPTCLMCGKRKAPVGRDVPAAAAESYCHPSECWGYDHPPWPSNYWREDEHPH